MAKEKREIKFRGSDIPKLLDSFVEVGKGGYLIKVDPSKKRSKLIFGICGDSFALFDINKETVQFCNPFK